MTIDESSVAMKTPSVVLESAVHLYELLVAFIYMFYHRPIQRGDEGSTTKLSGEYERKHKSTSIINHYYAEEYI